MDDAAKVLASDLPTDQTKFVYIGLSPRFFKVYDSQGNRLGRVDTKDSENAIFLPGIYVRAPTGWSRSLSPNSIPGAGPWRRTRRGGIAA